MSAIRHKHTKPELLVRRALHRAGFRFRLHPKLPGRPDLVLPKYRTAIFVHGCFWHRHQCRYGQVVPATRTEFWMTKLAGNVERDQRNQTALKAAGWKVMVLWECEMDEDRLQRVVEELRGLPAG